MRLGVHMTSFLLAVLVPLTRLPARAATMIASPSSAAEVQRGRYLAIAGDCAACHTAPLGKPFAGGLAVATPIGPIFSTNITPSRADGIGADTLQQFSDALRKGIRRDGKRLYPAMPYTAYAQLNDEDVRALYAYFMHGVQPVNIRSPQTHLSFPFDIRASLALWDAVFLARRPFRPDPKRSTQWNRGAYLVRGLAHCGTCHTPRNWMLAEKPSRLLSGASLGTWFAPNITPDAESGIGDWTTQQVTDYLKHGRAAGKAQAAGPMAEAVDHSLEYLTDADLAAIAKYLKSIPPRHERGETRPVDAWGGPYADLASLRGRALPTTADEMSGPQLYDAYCATCHEDRGQGSFHGGLPPLFHNTATGRRNTDNLVMTVLDGIGGSAGSGVIMPGFAHELSDRQIATLGTYLMRHFGNPAATVISAQVRMLRRGGPPSHLVLLARIALAIALLILLLLLFEVGAALTRHSRRATAKTPR